MKRIMIVCLSAVMSLANYAQWKKVEFEADELKGNEAYTSYSYNEPGVGSFIFWSNLEGQFRLWNEIGIFNYESTSSQFGSYKGMVVHVGLYDSNDKMKEKFDMWLDSESDKPTILKTRNAGAMSNPIGQKKKVKKIMEHLRNVDGYVRILAETYGEKRNFDLKIPRINVE